MHLKYTQVYMIEQASKKECMDEWSKREKLILTRFKHCLISCDPDHVSLWYFVFVHTLIFMHTIGQSK